VSRARFLSPVPSAVSRLVKMMSDKEFEQFANLMKNLIETLAVFDKRISRIEARLSL
jgi:hypothetical protein